MSHLSREELIDSLDRPLPPARQVHATSCPRCRHERAALAAVLHDVARVEMPEPSPLFWDHLSARVREQLAHEPPPSTPGWSSWLTSHWAISTAVVVTLCIITSWAGWRELRTLRTTPYRAAETSETGAAGSPPSGSAIAGAARPDAAGSSRIAEADDAMAAEAPARRGSVGPTLTAAAGTDAADWNLMIGLVDDVAWDDDGAAGGLSSLRPGSADAVVRELNVDERQELARLIHEEMVRRPPSS